MTTSIATAEISPATYLDWSHLLWDDPAEFVREGFGVKPEKFQAKFMRQLPDQNIIQMAVKASRGPGKTAEVAWAIIWWLLAMPNSKVGCTAPTEHQLDDFLWPEIHKWLDNSPMGLDRLIEWKKSRVEVRANPNEWFATKVVGKVKKTAIGMDEALSHQGMHADSVLWVVDEASGVPDAVYNAIEGSMSNAEFCKLIAIGNPNMPQGWFFDAFHKRRAYWWTQTINYRDVERSKERMRAWGDKLIEQHGPDHPYVRVKVLGEFPHQSEYGLVPLWAWERASTEEHHERIRSSQEYKGRTIGVDVADTGSNKHMMAGAEGSVVDWLQEIKKPSIDDLKQTTMDKIVAHAVMDKIISYRATTVVVDKDGGYANGVITVLRDLLSEQKRYDVTIIARRGSNAASDDQRFANARAEIHWKMKDEIEAGTVAVPDNEQAIIQATTIRWKRQDKGGRIVIWSKQEMKDKLGLESPDEWDSILLALAPALLGHVHVPRSGGEERQPKLPRRQRTTAAGFC